MSDMRTIVPRKKDRIIHVETALGIVNIWLGLMASQGQRVERVEILPNDYAGEPKVTLDGSCATRMIEQSQFCGPQALREACGPFVCVLGLTAF